MAANTSPTFPLIPNIGWATLTTANASYTGVGSVATIFTAGANSSRVNRIIAKPLGDNVQTVLRIFINNGSENTIPANNSLIKEFTLSGVTSSANTALDEVIWDINEELEPLHKINVTLGETVVGGWAITAFGEDY